MQVPNTLSALKSSFPKGKPQEFDGARQQPLPASIIHDAKANQLVMTIDLKPLLANPEVYLNRTRGTAKKGEAANGNGFYILASVPSVDDFGTVVKLDGESFGLQVSNRRGTPTAMSFTICDPGVAARRAAVPAVYVSESDLDDEADLDGA